jgi:hypothetical protein
VNTIYGLSIGRLAFIDEMLSKMNPHYAKRPLFSHGAVSIKTTLDAAIEDLCRMAKA